MTIVYLRLCYLCYLNADYVPAVATYLTPGGDEHDICERHLRLCKEQGLETWLIEEGNMIVEE